MEFILSFLNPILYYIVLYEENEENKGKCINKDKPENAEYL